MIGATGRPGRTGATGGNGARGQTGQSGLRGNPGAAALGLAKTVNKFDVLGELEKVEAKDMEDNARVNKLTMMLGIWIGIITLALFIVLAVVWKKLRPPTQTHNMTTLNDSESAFADSVYNKSSIVDFNGPFNDGKWNGAQDTTQDSIEDDVKVHQKR